MKNKGIFITYDGITTEDYTVTRRGIVHSKHGNRLTVKDGYVTITIGGKRRRLPIKEVIKQSYAEIKEVKPVDVKKVEPKVDTTNRDKVGTIIKEVTQASNKDIHNRPRNIQPINDIQTKNKSFLDVYNELHSQGIKNSKFMLWLNDDSLVGVNPNNPALSKEVRASVVREMILNPWYYLREVLKVELTLEKAIVALLLLRGQNPYCVTSDEEGVNDIVTKILSWFLLAEPNSDMSLIGRNKKESESSISDVVKAINSLPSMITKSMKSHVVTHSSNTVLYDSTLGSVKTITERVNSNATAASNAARGCTSNILYFRGLEDMKHAVYYIIENTPSFKNICNKTSNTASRVVVTTYNEAKNEDKHFSDKLLNTSTVWENSLLDNIPVTNDEEFIYVDFDKNRIEEIQESKLNWDFNESITRHAINLYDTLDFNNFNNKGIPVSVAADMIYDDRLGNINIDSLSFADDIVRDYTIRHISESLVRLGANDKSFDVSVAFDSLSETLFHYFGTPSANAVQTLIGPNGAMINRMIGLAEEFMKTAYNLENVKLVGQFGLLSVQSFHIMVLDIYKSSLNVPVTNS